MTQQYTTVEFPVKKFVKIVILLLAVGFIGGQIDARTGWVIMLVTMFLNQATTNPYVGVPFFGFIFIGLAILILKRRKRKPKQLSGETDLDKTGKKELKQGR